MKQKTTTILVMTAFSVLIGTSCARTETTPTAEQQAPAAAEPAPQSAWAPAPVQTAPQKQAKPAAMMGNTGGGAARPAATAPAPAAAPRPAAPVRPQPKSVTLAAGETIPVRVNASMTSEKNESGDPWTGTLFEPLVVEGLVIAERGATVEGRVSNVTRAGKVKGVAGLSVTLTRIHTADGQEIPVSASTYSVAGKDETKKDTAKVAIASGVGAAIGAIAGRGKGAAIGAGAGAAAGTGVVLATRGAPAVIAAESLIRFRVTEPVTITEKLK